MRGFSAGMARRLRPVLAAVLTVGAGAGVAVSPVAAVPVVQPLPGPDQIALTDARAVLLRDPDNLGALREAAVAAVRLGDPEAALTYVEEAEKHAPADPVIASVRAAILALRGEPQAALDQFAKAEANGAPVADLAADRALAYDLIGDQPSAQYYYRIAAQLLQQRDVPPNNYVADELTRRHALSLAVGGDFAAGDAVLRPLLERQDLSGWRTRAFMLAISGNEREAVALLGTVLPAELAAQISPYMRVMPRLSNAQQVAAATFGRFPRMDAIAADPQARSDRARSDRAKASRRRARRSRGE
ncbi:M48 family metallopeptidase [Croceicoccus sp. YJ47]|uniref:tetratricopeptide repeat protein n=1 Tax=Croceicoccus sp. YJ47 TaxID=2798724 RepID=UPI001922C6F4|nr:hypothetical protein [Croceicoccus sp. YJ47]QQN74745.1 hypothetical protein JD971_03155 [Croceicoccus sp. YJ47]